MEKRLRKLEHHSIKFQEIGIKIDQKKTNFTVKKIESSLFFSYTNEKSSPMKQSKTAHKEFLANNVQVKSLSAEDLRSRLKQAFQKKALFPLTKVLGLYVLVLSHMKNVRELFIRLRKLYWHFLWNW